MDPFLGEIRMFGGTFAPTGWQMCNGQMLAISQYAALFAILGTTYGGNGTTTFALPDLRGRVPVHQGQGPGLSVYVPGESTGAENVSILYNNMPVHNHLVNVDTATGTQPSPAGHISAAVAPLAAEKIYSSNAANNTMAATTISSAGGNVPISIRQPVLCVTFIIAMQGLFPSRN